MIILILAALIFIIGMLLMANKTEEDRDLRLCGVGLSFIILAVVLAVGSTYDEERAYKNGQVDAVNGKIYYELSTRPNGEKAWTRKSTTSDH